MGSGNVDVLKVGAVRLYVSSRQTMNLKAPRDLTLTVNVVVEFHKRAVRLSDKRLKELFRSNSRPGSFGPKYEAESIE